MKRRLYAPAVLVVGLLSAQIVATAHVYLSNLDLLQATEAMMRSGYLAVPNARVAKHLDSLATAVAGGLFFTLSIGAGLSLVTLIGAWLWDRAFRRRRTAIFLYLLIWAAGMVLVNSNGWNLAGSAYLVVVPLVTGFTAIHLLPARTTLVSTAGVFWPVSAAIILALMWGLVLDRNMFSNIRDHLLLGNRAGQSITNAYYAYTLFPAEAFKSLEQKQIRTCVLGSSLDRANWTRLERTVRALDYLPVLAGYPADLTIGLHTDQKRFSLENNRQPVLSVPSGELLGSPDKALNAYSSKLDRNRMFRTLTLACLLLGLPLVLFSFLFSVLGVLPNLFLTGAVSDLIAAICCIVVGGILLVPVYQGHTAIVVPANPSIALSAPSPITRIAALRQACEDHRDIAVEVKKQGIENSPHIAERYWLARSLAYTRDPAAHAMLLALVDDPAPIVVCQALWALGERKDQAAVPEIISRINTSPHWYIQMYGYRALRTLGWVQPRSPLLSY
ncbi:HEAT repeat domain-containing protein [Desulfosarcina sp.]|uniref:HEAT repeat domain-containing protein n=1 Tax=Desulfosarcina sp. TaxID=2027861 RepID=UPI0029B0BC19|nr:HEAT repeat domain-containing protein [Desulfosarcina sp.]MDX2454092.1 HEAT repeat domain-containing protein [Desulfosarcina sp.]MDX2491774.1 HEAT repeat domain-containing protein [Desulfosarcina sp.]